MTLAAEPENIAMTTKLAPGQPVLAGTGVNANLLRKMIGCRPQRIMNLYAADPCVAV